MNWNEIAKNYSKISFPNKVKFENKQTKNGILILNVQQGFGPELQMIMPKLLNKINDFLGYKAISKIKIKQVDLNINFNKIRI